jgi:hypothetical protein
VRPRRLCDSPCVPQYKRDELGHKLERLARCCCRGHGDTPEHSVRPQNGFSLERPFPRVPCLRGIVCSCCRLVSLAREGEVEHEAAEELVLCDARLRSYERRAPLHAVHAAKPVIAAELLVSYVTRAPCALHCACDTREALPPKGPYGPCCKIRKYKKTSLFFLIS